MDENMKNVEATTEETYETDMTQGSSDEIVTSGPSKGFVALVGGLLVAGAVGTVLAIKRHKKKKARKAQDEQEVFDEHYDEEWSDEDSEEPEEEKKEDEK